jgi:hypothetical protein
VLDVSTAINVGAVVVSISAAVVSTWLARHQFRAQRYSNYVDPLIDLLNEFRSLEFHRDYAYVCQELPKQSSEHGISGLAEEAQRRIYNIGYLFQLYAILAQLDIVDHRFVGALLRRRYVEVWAALRPFVERERELQRLPPESILNWLEVFATTVSRLPADEVARLRARHQGRRQYRRATIAAD